MYIENYTISKNETNTKVEIWWQIQLINKQ